MWRGAVRVSEGAREKDPAEAEGEENAVAREVEGGGKIRLYNAVNVPNVRRTRRFFICDGRGGNDRVTAYHAVSVSRMIPGTRHGVMFFGYRWFARSVHVGRDQAVSRGRLRAGPTRVCRPPT